MWIEYLQTFKLYNMPQKKGKSDDASPSGAALLPIKSDDPLESDTWYFKYVSFYASGGDLNQYEKLYKYTDWAKVFEIYTLKQACNHG
jgi:hypothetical protein